MNHVAKIEENVESRRNGTDVPDAHKIDPARLCRIIEDLVIDKADGTPENEIFSQIYMIAHLAAWNCTKNHVSWLAEFLKLEEEIEKINCSPNDKKIYDAEKAAEENAAEGKGS